MGAEMPELPDVEGFKTVLARNALGKAIAGVVVSDARILGELSARTFSVRLGGARLVAARRHGKYLMAEIDRAGWLVLHFGMSGALQFVGKGGEEPAFTRLRLDFVNDGALAYTSRRMLGRISLAEAPDDVIAQEKLGPDALDAHFDFEAFKEAVAGTTRSVKSVLMDQHIIAGIGNIYSDEILFQARIDPSLRIKDLSPNALKRLYVEMHKVLKIAIACGAGSEQFVDRLPKGSLLPERKKGGRCPRCHAPLKTLKMQGRTAYCCPRCQNC
jgi:formamidopyrimidine-DNA glycosylase